MFELGSFGALGLIYFDIQFYAYLLCDRVVDSDEFIINETTRQHVCLQHVYIIELLTSLFAIPR